MRALGHIVREAGGEGIPLLEERVEQRLWQRGGGDLLEAAGETECSRESLSAWKSVLRVAREQAGARLPARNFSSP